MPMLPLELFRHRNFAVANAQTFIMYGGIGLLGFFVTIYLQQVAGWSALQSGVTGLIPTVVMFFLSARMGRLADKYGPRPFLTVGPLLVAAGFALMERYGTTVSFLTEVLPALLVFSFGLALTVSPLTATVLADASEMDAGIASAVNNAIAQDREPGRGGRRGRRRRLVLRRAARSPPRPSPAGVKPGGAARGRAPDVRQHRRRRGAVAATRVRPPRDRAPPARPRSTSRWASPVCCSCSPVWVAWRSAASPGPWWRPATAPAVSSPVSPCRWPTACPSSGPGPLTSQPPPDPRCAGPARPPPPPAQ